MAFEELNTPIPAVKPEDVPDLMAYSLLTNFIADLRPRETTPGMAMWSEFRYRYIHETNYPRWSSTFEIDGVQHTVALFGVQGELPSGESYGHTSLRCSCCLPDFKSWLDLNAEYRSCPAQDLVINERAATYRALLRGDELGQFDDESLQQLTVFLISMVQKNPLAWPPSNRNDRILVDPLAMVFDIPKERMRANVEELAEKKVLRLHGETHPSVSLAA